VLFAGVEKVESILGFFDSDRVLVGAVFEDELLEVEECPFVVDFLSHLDESPPCVLGSQPGAFGTLSVSDNELDLKDLLQNGSREDLSDESCFSQGSRGKPLPDQNGAHFFLDCQLESQPLAVRLCPEKVCIHKPDFLETFELAEADGKQFARL
jgi:hypothetical protein